MAANVADIVWYSHGVYFLLGKRKIFTESSLSVFDSDDGECYFGLAVFIFVISNDKK